MRRLLVAVLIGALLPASAFAGRPTVALYQWYQVPHVAGTANTCGTRINDTLQSKLPYAFSDPPIQNFAAWTGTVYAPDLDKIIVAKFGGHVGTTENNVRLFDVSGNQQWCRINQSSPSTLQVSDGGTGECWADAGVCGASAAGYPMADGYPPSVHTFGQPAYVPPCPTCSTPWAVGFYFSLGGSPYSGGGDDHAWKFAFDQTSNPVIAAGGGTWTNLGTSSTTNGMGRAHCAFDTGPADVNARKVYCLALGPGSAVYFLSWTPPCSALTNCWTALEISGNSGIGDSAYTSAVIVPSKRKLFYTGQTVNHLYYRSLDGTPDYNEHQVVLSAYESEIFVAPCYAKIGLAYDSQISRLVLHPTVGPTSGAIYLIDPDTGTTTKPATTGTPPPADGVFECQSGYDLDQNKMQYVGDGLIVVHPSNNNPDSNSSDPYFIRTSDVSATGRALFRR